MENRENSKLSVKLVALGLALLGPVFISSTTWAVGPRPFKVQCFQTQSADTKALQKYRYQVASLNSKIARGQVSKAEAAQLAATAIAGISKQSRNFQQARMLINEIRSVPSDLMSHIGDVLDAHVAPFFNHLVPNVFRPDYKPFNTDHMLEAFEKLTPADVPEVLDLLTLRNDFTSELDGAQFLPVVEAHMLESLRVKVNSRSWKAAIPVVEEAIIQKLEQVREDPQAIEKMIHTLLSIKIGSERIAVELLELRRAELQKPLNQQNPKLIERLRGVTYQMGNLIMAPSPNLQKWLVTQPVEAKDLEEILLPVGRVPSIPFLPEVNQALLKVMKTSDRTWNRLKAAQYFQHIGLYTNETKAVLLFIISQKWPFPEIKVVAQEILNKYP